MTSVTACRQNGCCTCVIAVWTVFRQTLKPLVTSVLSGRKFQKGQMEWVVLVGSIKKKTSLLEQLAKEDKAEQKQKREQDTANELINEASKKMAAVVELQSVKVVHTGQSSDADHAARSDGGV